MKRLEYFAAPLQSLPFDDGCAHDYGLIRADLAAQSKPIGANDLMIAAIGRHLRVVTLPDGVTLHNAFPDRRFKP